jgi:hypothetical protein
MGKPHRAGVMLVRVRLRGLVYLSREVFDLVCFYGLGVVFGLLSCPVAFKPLLLRILLRLGGCRRVFCRSRISSGKSLWGGLSSLHVSRRMNYLSRQS